MRRTKHKDTCEKLKRKQRKPKGHGGIQKKHREGNRRKNRRNTEENHKKQT